MEPSVLCHKYIIQTFANFSPARIGCNCSPNCLKRLTRFPLALQVEKASREGFREESREDMDHKTDLRARNNVGRLDLMVEPAGRGLVHGNAPLVKGKKAALLVRGSCEMKLDAHLHVIFYLPNWLVGACTTKYVLGVGCSWTTSELISLVNPPGTKRSLTVWTEFHLLITSPAVINTIRGHKYVFAFVWSRKQRQSLPACH